MSFDDYKVEYHLTSHGWISGTTRFFDAIQGGEVARPDDAVETWLRHETQRSGFSPSEIERSKLWTAPNVSEPILEELHRQFPKPKLF